MADSLPSTATLTAPLPPRWLHRFAWLVVGATLFLICSGGMVTSKNAGLAVPDWPTTFGYNMFLFPVSKWIGGIFFEHVHRLIASTVGFLTIILAVWLGLSERRRWVRNLGYISLGAVVLQGVLGGMRVTMLKDQIGIFHAALAQAFFGLLVVISLVTSPLWGKIQARYHEKENGRPLAWVAVITSLIIYLQLGLGATMRHQHRDLSIFDFPTAYHQWIPDTSAAALARINAWRDARGFSDVTAFQIWLQMAHRGVALLIAAGVVTFWFLVRRKLPASAMLRNLSTFWVALLCVQITLGAWTIWSNKAADIATAHVAMGAIMLAFGISLSTIAMRFAYAEGRSEAIAQTELVPGGMEVS